MNNVRVFAANESGDYRALISRYALDLDVYYRMDLLAAEAARQQAQAEIFTLESGTGLFIYPYLKRPLPAPFELYFDIISPYGYAGPYASDDATFAEGEECLLDHLTRKNTVSEFVRYHFLFNASRRFTQRIENSKNRTIVLLNTTAPWNRIWDEQFSKTNRNMVRKVEKAGFEIQFGFDADLLDEFMRHYSSTMARVNADESFIFPVDFYLRLSEGLGQDFFIARAIRGTDVAGTAMFLRSGSFLTYYLSARNPDYPEIPATNFILSKVAQWATDRRIEHFNIGGGLSDDAGDALFRFKRNFSQETAEFHVGKRIHNPDIYSQIREHWIRQHGLLAFEKRAHLLQFYR
jgi:hypothetical protein